MPLDEAVAKGLIPCAGCGAKGAAVKRVDGKPHFLCPKCAGGKSTAWIGALVAVAVFAAAAWWLTQGTAAPPPDPLAEAEALVRAGRFREARLLLEARPAAMAGDPRPLILLGHVLLNLGATEKALEAFRGVLETDPDSAAVGGIWIGVALQRLSRSAEALPYLETPFPNAALDEQRKASLAECLLDLERYDDALRLLGDGRDPRRLWARHRALRYGGRDAEAEALLKDVDPKELWPFRVTQGREAGDFEGAKKTIDVRFKEAPGDRLKLVRAAMSISADTGDAATLEALAGELAAGTDVQLRAEGMVYRAIALLQLGKAEEAKRQAETFLAKTDPELSAIRLDRLQMLRLAGRATDADLETEAKRVSHFHANDLYWFLAVVTGDKAWAEKGLAATPGRNFPYHALKRLAGK